MTGYSFFGGHVSPEMVEELREQTCGKAPQRLEFAFSVEDEGTHCGLLRESYRPTLRKYPLLLEALPLFGARADRVETKYGVYVREPSVGKSIGWEEYNSLAGWNTGVCSDKLVLVVPYVLCESESGAAKVSKDVAAFGEWVMGVHARSKPVQRRD